MNKFLALLTIFFAISCAAKTQNQDTPVWYNSPKQNSSQNLYGVAEGNTLEEATRFALADAAARLMVNLSSESSLLREENQTSVNEEMRQNVRQNIEKISFSNFNVSSSKKIGEKFYVEVQVERAPFLREQKERVGFLEKQISDLEKNAAGKNTIQKRNSLLKILDLSKELELKSRILAGAGDNIDLEKKLARIAFFENQLNSLSDKIEFYFEMDSPKEISKIIRTSLNREKIKIAPSRNSFDSNQVVIRIKSSSKTQKVYESFMTKVEIDFENLAGGKVSASNSIEIIGSSVINEQESYAAALKNLEEKISQDGILKIIGIIN